MKLKSSIKLLLFVLPLLFLLTFCKKNSTDVKVIPYTNLSIVLDKPIYAPGDVARVTITNHTDMDLVLDNCGSEPGFDFQKQIGGKWNNLIVPDCSGEGAPFNIAAGSKFTHTLTIPEIIQSGSHEGQYRLLFWLKKKNSHEFLDKEDRASDPIHIK
jgi:hypothetical protein